MDEFYSEINKHIEDARKWNCKLDFPINEVGNIINLLDSVCNGYRNPVTKSSHHSTI